MVSQKATFVAADGLERKANQKDIGPSPTPPVEGGKKDEIDGASGSHYCTTKKVPVAQILTQNLVLSQAQVPIDKEKSEKWQQITPDCAKDNADKATEEPHSYQGSQWRQEPLSKPHTPSFGTGWTPSLDFSKETIVPIWSASR